MRRAGRAFLAAAALIVAYLFAAVAGALVPGKTAEVAATSSADGRADILLLSGPIHYDILLPADAPTRAAFAFAVTAGVPVDNPGVEWIAVGWGSRAFYTTAGTYADLRPDAVWRAVTGDDAVIRVDVIGPLPAHPALRRLRVSPHQLAALREAILADLLQRQPLALDGFNATDAFFLAQGHFDILRTCNVWVSLTLRQAGIQMGGWTPTPYAVTLSLWWNGHLEQTVARP